MSDSDDSDLGDSATATPELAFEQREQMLALAFEPREQTLAFASEQRGQAATLGVESWEPASRGWHWLYTLDF